MSITVQICDRIPSANRRGTNARPIGKGDLCKIKNVHFTIPVDISSKTDHKGNGVNSNIVPDNCLSIHRGSSRGYVVNSSSQSSNTPRDGNVLAIAREKHYVRRSDYCAVGSEDQSEGLLGRTKIGGRQP